MDETGDEVSDVAGAGAVDAAAAGRKARAPSWRAELTEKYIKARRAAEPPVGYGADGKLIFGSDPACRGYILWDASRDAPPGFGVKVGSKKTYVVRRKVRGASIMPTVGNFADFADIGQARKKAAAMALRMAETGRNPNELDRRESAAELTLGRAMAAYREHLVGRAQKPARPQTLRVFDRCARKHQAWGWDARKVRDISTDEIEAQFAKGAAFPAANEQAFRWPLVAVRWAVDKERLVAAAERRAPTLGANPFDILVLHKHFRTAERLSREREERGKRNPLRPATTLGPFLEAAWSKRRTNDNETGADFLILMLLWGCRKSEHAQCVWGELLSEHGPAGVGRKATSHVWMEDGDYGPHVFFHQTKNGRGHRLPIAPMALELLRRRQALAAEEALRRGFGAKSRAFVFPARSPFSKTGHYSDAKALLESLREEIGVERLTPHDLRRSFGAAMASLDAPESIKRAFLNHADAHVTDTYTKAEWEHLRSWMARIEQAILASAPNAYNALKPLEWPPLPAPPPHVCKLPASRSGRPRRPRTR